jgi:hypothetical protein
MLHGLNRPAEQSGVPVAVTHYSRRLAISVLLLLQGGMAFVAEAAAPNSCGLITPAAWSAVLSRPVTGGTTSVVNDPASTASSCLYQAGQMFVTVQVNQLATAAAAQKEYAEQLSNSRVRDERESQRTTVESSIGEGAFSSAAANGSEVEFTAVQGLRVVTLGLVGAGAAAVPHDRLRALMQSALAH